MSSKRCFKCLCTKPLAEFYRHAEMADGHLNKCKSCTKADVARHRIEHMDEVRAYDRARSSMPHRRAKAKSIGARWRSNYPNRKRAQNALRRAVLAGQIKPWPVCEIPECNGTPEAHHPHYDLPLVVVWLCSAHHHQVHAMTRKAA